MRKNHISGYLKRVLAVACAAAMVATSVPTSAAFATESTGDNLTNETAQVDEPTNDTPATEEDTKTSGGGENTNTTDPEKSGEQSGEGGDQTGEGGSQTGEGGSQTTDISQDKTTDGNQDKPTDTDQGQTTKDDTQKTGDDSGKTTDDGGKKTDGDETTQEDKKEEVVIDFGIKEESKLIEGKYVKLVFNPKSKVSSGSDIDIQSLEYKLTDSKDNTVDEGLYEGSDIVIEAKDIEGKLNKYTLTITATDSENRTYSDEKEIEFYYEMPTVEIVVDETASKKYKEDSDEFMNFTFGAKAEVDAEAELINEFKYELKKKGGDEIISSGSFNKDETVTINANDLEATGDYTLSITATDSNNKKGTTDRDLKLKEDKGPNISYTVTTSSGKEGEVEKLAFDKVSLVYNISVSDECGLKSVEYYVLNVDGEETEHTIEEYKSDDKASVSYKVEATARGQVVVIAYNKNGTKQECKTNTLVVEKAAPTISVKADTNDKKINSVTITATDRPDKRFSGIKSIKYLVKGLKWDEDSKKIEVTELKEGGISKDDAPTSLSEIDGLKQVVIENELLDIDHTKYAKVEIEVTATDFCGNAVKETIKLTEDKTPPTIEINLENQGGQKNYINQKDDKLTISIVDEASGVESGKLQIIKEESEESVFECNLEVEQKPILQSLDENSIGELEDGNYKAVVTATDNNNSSAEPVEFDFVVDRTAPKAEIKYTFTADNSYLYEDEASETDYTQGTVYTNKRPEVKLDLTETNIHNITIVTNKDGEPKEDQITAECIGKDISIDDIDGAYFYKIYGTDKAGNALKVTETFEGSIKTIADGKDVKIPSEEAIASPPYVASVRIVLDKKAPEATIVYTFGENGGNYLYDAEKSIDDYSAGTVYTHEQPIVNVSVTENNIAKDGVNKITISENKTGLAVDETIKKEGNVYSKEYKPAENNEYLYFYKVFGKDKAGNVVKVHEELGKGKIVNSKLKDSKVEEFNLDNSVQSAEETYNAQIRIVYDKTSPVAKVTYDLAKQVGYIYKDETDEANYTKGTVYSNTNPVFKVTITEANTPAGEDGKGKNLDNEANKLSMVKYAKYDGNEQATKETKGFLYKANEEFISAFDKKVDKDGRYYWKVFGTDKAGNKLEVRESFDKTTTIAGEDNEKLASTTKDVDTLEKAKLSYSIVRDTVNPVATFDANTPGSRGGIVTNGVWRSYFNKEDNTIGTPEFTIDETNFDGARIEAGYLHKTGSQYSSVTIDEWNSDNTDAFKESENVYSIDGNSLEDGVYRFTIEGEDKAGNRIVAGSSAEINKLDDAGNGELWTSYKIIDSLPPKMTLTVGQGKDGGSITGVFYRVNQESLLTYSPFRKVKQAYGSITTEDKSGTRIGYKVESTVKSSGRNVVLDKQGFKDNNSASFATSNAEQIFRVLNVEAEDLAGNKATLAETGQEDYLYLDVTRPTNDNIKPKVSITRKSTPSITRWMGKNGQSVDLYNKNVTLGLNVFDPDKLNSSSGLKQIRVYTTMDGSNVSGTSYTFDVNFNGDKGNKKGVKPSDLTYQWTKDITFPAGSFQSNNILIRVEAIDNSGNVAATKEYNFGIDTIGPKVTVYFENNDAQNGKYFKADRRARIEFIDRNIDWGMITISTQGSVGGENVRGGEGNGGNDVWSRVASYTVDGDYTLTVTGTDALGNAFVGSVDYTGGGRNVAPREFTIDKTAPVINVSFDNNSAQNGKYYKDARTATISVREHNFNASEVKVTQTADIQQGSVSAPGVGGFGGGGDDHSASIHYGEDGNYTLTVNYTDLAGNPAQEVRVDEFVIDQTPPTLKFVMPDETKGASQIFAGDIAPQIDFGDINMTRGMASISLTGMKANSNALKLIEDSFENFQGTVRYENLKKVRESDDIYTATAVVTDLAGNTVEKTITFSVNRFGSTYDYNKNDFTTNLVSGYYTNEPKDVILREINVNQLSEHKLTLYKDGDNRILKEGTDYSFEERLVNGHYEYIYTIFAKNFEEEGNYNIIATSKDKANNTNSNSTVKGDDGSNEVPLRFAVDKTAPTNLITGVDITKNKFTEDHITLYIEPRDNMNAVASFIVRVTDKNGNILQEFEISGKELAEYFEKNKGVYTLTIDQNNQWQTIEVVTTDAAGNESVDHRIEQNTAYKVLVTPNLFYQYINRLPLVGGSLAALAGLIFFLIAKRKKDDEEEENAA